MQLNYYIIKKIIIILINFFIYNKKKANLQTFKYIWLFAHNNFYNTKITFNKKKQENSKKKIILTKV